MKTYEKPEVTILEFSSLEAIATANVPGMNGGITESGALEDEEE